MINKKRDSRFASCSGASAALRVLPIFVPAFLLAAVTAVADEVTPYRFDDGTATNAFGIGANGVLVNEFTTQLGFETVYGLEIVFGQGAADPFNLVVYSDPNNDGNFSDAAEPKYLQPAVRPALESGTYETVVYNFVSGVSFAPGEVFYVGVEELVSGGYNIGVAFDVEGGGRTWVAFDGNVPADAGTVAPLTSFPGFANDAMIRALVAPVAIPEPATFAALGGLVALGLAGGRRRRRVR